MESQLFSWRPVFVLSFFFISTLFSSLFGQEEKYTGRLINEDIAVNQELTITDPKFEDATEWNLIEQHNVVRNLVMFQIREDDPKIKPESCTYTVDLRLRYWDESADPDGAYTGQELFSLEIDYDTTRTHKTEVRAYRFFYGMHKMEVRVEGFTKTGCLHDSLPPLEIYSEILVDRDYSFNWDEKPNISSSFTSPQSDFATFTWDNVPGAEEYQVEWTFYDDSTTVVNELNSGTDTYTDFNWLFRHNASRISTGNTFARISLLYPDGYVFYRVRAIQCSPTGERITGKWSSIKNAAITLANFQEKLDVTWHETDLNWQAQTTFAEEGKFLPSIQYFDGSLRNRQSVTYSNAIDMTIAGQTIYDQQGRPSMEVLPAPTFSSTIGFDPLLSTIDGINPYTNSHYLGSDQCLGTPDSMSTATGASRYYSPNNPKQTEGFHQYIPDAQGFPFSVTEYTLDQTGRVQRQGGVGETFQLGQGHEVQYFYGKPSQRELDRLFGNEVGEASHYLKNMMIDQNSQVSVSYIDGHGRTIATSLAGGRPSFVNENDPLDTYVDAAPLTIDLLNNQAVTYGLNSTYALLVPDQANYTFNYSLDSTSFSPECLPDGICYDCLYDVRITISDECDNDFNQGAPIDTTIYNFSVESTLFDTLCSNSPSGLIATIELNNLPVGRYIVTKELRISQTALEYYTDHFLTQTTCLPSVEQLTNEFLGEMDLTGCNYTCDSCLADLGTQAEYVSYITTEIPSLSTQEAEDRYDQLVEQCLAFCEPVDECKTLLDRLAMDFIPGTGQYALYNTDSVTVNSSTLSTDPTSIFYRPSTDLAYQDTDMLNYPLLDENGDPDTVYINGIAYLPWQLDAADFISHYRFSWGYALAEKFHPEYCYYTCCETFNQGQGSQYDSLLWEINTWDEAVSLGVIDTLGNFLNDSLFLTGGAADSCAMILDSLMNDIVPGEADSLSFTDLLDGILFNGGIDCSGLGQGSDADNNLAWITLRNYYLGLRSQILTDKCAQDSGCVNADCVGNGEAECPTGVTNHYADK
ncbi:MAG: DUF6443 domain-containing protein, partial [Bacteroidota bacterium]